MSVKKSIPVALISNARPAQSNMQMIGSSNYHQENNTPGGLKLNTSTAGSRSNISISNGSYNGQKIDTTVQTQIDNLVNSIIRPKLENNEFKSILIPTASFQKDTFDLIRKNMLVPQKTEDLMLGFAKDANVLILSSQAPGDVNIYDTISNNMHAMANHIPISNNLGQFRGKLDMVLETLKIAASVKVTQNYSARIAKSKEYISSDIMSNWKRMEDLKQYSKVLVDHVEAELLADLDHRISTQDITNEEINVIIHNIDAGFSEFKTKLQQRYSDYNKQKNTFDELKQSLEEENNLVENKDFLYSAKKSQSGIVDFDR